MSGLGQHIQTADWKAEKHVPVIEAPDQVTAGEAFEVRVTVGKEIPHPNTTEHYIAWISLYFHPEGEKFTHHVGHFEFGAHGAATAGPNQGPVYTQPQVSLLMKVSKAGTLYALAFCNIHGLWESSKAIMLK